MSSFAQQYGIRLKNEYDDISVEEYYQLLKTLNGDTPLGYYIRIRSETDSKKIQEMSKNEKEIRQEWFTFRNSKKPVWTTKEKEQKVDEFHKLIKSMFGGDKR